MRVFVADLASDCMMPPRLCAAGGVVRRTVRFAGLCGAAALVLASAPAYAATQVTNMGLTAKANSLGFSTSSTEEVYQSFTVGASNNYVLTSISAQFLAPIGSPGNIEINLYNSSGSNPGTKLKTLTGTANPGGAQYSYSCSTTTGECNLSAGGTYWIGMKTATVANRTSNYRAVAAVNGTSQTGDGTDDGWALGDKAKYRQGSDLFSDWTDGPIFLAVTANIATNNNNGNQTTNSSSTVPAKITTLKVDPGNTKLVASWSSQGQHGSNLVLNDFDVQYKTTTVSTWTDWTVNTEASTTITGLTNGTIYQVRVRAGNQTGEGPWSNPVNAEPGTPSIPKHLLVAPGSAKLAVSWQASSGNGSSVTGYDVQYRAGTRGGWANHTHTGTSTSTTISTLTNNTAYYVRVRGKNSQGDSPWAHPASGTPTTAAAPTSANFTKVINPNASRSNVLVSGFPFLDSGGSYLREVQIVTLPATASGKLQLRKCKRMLGTRCTGGYTHTDVTAGQIVGNEYYQGSRSRTWLKFKPESGFTSATFTFKVRNQQQVASSATYTATLVATPAAPIGLTATAGNTQVRLSWTNPNDTAISRWQYQYKLNANYGSWTNIIGSGPDTTSYAVTGLTNSTQHTFKLRAVSAGGNGTESAEVTATPVAAVPSKPSSFKALAGNENVLLTWADPGDSSLTKYQIRQKTTGSFGNWADIPNSSALTTSYRVQSLTNGTQYTFQIRAMNPTGNTNSDEVAATPNLPKPRIPKNLRAYGYDQQIYLSWTPSGDASITRYEYFVQEQTGRCEGWRTISGSSAATVTFLFHLVWLEREFFDGTKTRTTCDTQYSLSNNTSYTIRIRAVNAAGAGPASETITATPRSPTFSPQKPKPPTALEASGRSGSVVLLWSNPNDASITGYRYSYKEEGTVIATAVDIPNSGASTTSYTVPNLTNGTSYVFYVRAVNGNGEGPRSPSATATPSTKPGKPLSLQAQSGTAGITLSWRAGESSITDYQYRKRAGLNNWESWITIANSSASTTTHTVSSSLTQGKVNSFQIRARNTSGYGAPSRVASATPVPAKPTGLSAMPAANAQVTLTWADPNDSSITKYQVRLKDTTPKTHVACVNIGTDYNPIWKCTITPNVVDAYSNWFDVPGSGAATTTAAVYASSGLLMLYQIRALNPTAAGAPSDEVSATSGKLTKPENLTATAGDQSVDLYWTLANSATITQYQYQQKTTGDYGSWTDIANSSATTTSHTVGSLVNGTAYTFRIRGVGPVGETPASDEATATPGPVPAKPTGLSAAARHQRAVLTWTDPSDADITGYQYRQKSGTKEYSQWTGVANSGATTTQATAGSLENGTAYTFQIRALSATAAGPASDEASATATARPGKPTGLSASPRDRSAALTWADPSDDTVSKYQYQQKTAGGWGSSWTDIANSGAATTSFTAPGLTNGTLHYFRIRAWNAAEPGLASEEATATPDAAPTAPSGVSAQAGDQQATLRWNLVTDKGVTKFQARYKTTEDYGSWSDIGYEFGTVSGTVTGLANGTAHTFQIRGVSQYGDGAASAEVSATPFGAPAKPTGLSAMARNRAVGLSWTDPGDATITGWQYRQKAGGSYGNWQGIANSGASTTSHAIDSLTNDTAYTFQIRARNASGAGAASDEASATPSAVPLKPTGPCWWPKSATGSCG